MTTAIEVQEKPILFSGAMVKAILAEQKTQTRRVMKPQPELVYSITDNIRHSPWIVGTRLWVRESALYKSAFGEYYCRVTDCWGNFEAWTADGKTHWHHDDRIKTWEDAVKPLSPLEYCVGGFSAEKAGQKKDSFTLTLLRCDTGKIIEPYQGNTIIEKREIVFRRHVPGIHMPRWASRLTLEIVKVRVERVQDISLEDCLAEGVIWTDYWDNVKGADIARYAEKHPKEWTVDESVNQGWIDYTRLAYRGLWDSINEKRGFGWEKNPWVWVIEFKRIKGGE